jgi:ribonuclease P protein subunit POP4
MSPKDTTIAQSLLTRAHSPASATRIYTEKIQQRPLHLKPTTPSTSTPNAQHQRRILRDRKLTSRKKKLKPAPLSSRQKRSLCLYDIPRASQTYTLYAPLHQMWLGYIREVLGIDEYWNGEDGREVQIGAAAAAKLCAADYHGAEVEVVRSRCVSRVGIRGIVVKDSKFVFEIVGRGNGVRVVPKEHTVFGFRIPRGGEGGENGDEEVEGGEEGKGGRRKDLLFELHGDQFIYRAADRANRKFKSHFLPDV